MKPKLNNTSHGFKYIQTHQILKFLVHVQLFHVDEAETLKAFFSVSVRTLVLTTEPVGPIIQDYKRSQEQLCKLSQAIGCVETANLLWYMRQ